MEDSSAVHFRSAKELLDSGSGIIPEVYVWPLDERPSDVSSSEDIPVVDLSQDRNILVQQIGNACKDWGFLQVINHGIPRTAVEQVFSAVEEFFSLPKEEKLRCSGAKCRYGTSYNLSKDKVYSWRDMLVHDCSPWEEVRELLPDTPASYRNAVEEYSKHVRSLMEMLLEIIAESLELDPGYINRTLGSSQFMVMNYYPPCPQPELALGLPAHTDTGTLTVLAQDSVGGLQIRHDGKWIFVQPVADALIINVADQLQILSNDRYKSVEHRAAVNSQNTRISIAYGEAPSWDSTVKPAPELSELDKKVVFNPIVFRDFLIGVATRSPDEKKPFFESLKT